MQSSRPQAGCIEKAGLPDFGFSQHGEIGAWLSQRRLLMQNFRRRRFMLMAARLPAERWTARHYTPWWSMDELSAGVALRFRP